MMSNPQHGPNVEDRAVSEYPNEGTDLVKNERAFEDDLFFEPTSDGATIHSGSRRERRRTVSTSAANRSVPFQCFPTRVPVNVSLNISRVSPKRYTT